MLSIKPPGWEKIQTNRVMNKLEKELLETQLVRFHQKQLKYLSPLIWHVLQD